MQKLSSILLAVFLVSALAPFGALAAEVPVPQNGSDPAAYLNADGSLNIPANFSGSLDLNGWDIRLDPKLGPVLRPAMATPDTWEALTDNGLDGVVRALALVGTDLYVGGTFTQSFGAATPNLNNIAKYDTLGSGWEALSDDGLDGSVETFLVIGTDLYVGGNYSQSFGGAKTGLGNIARYDTFNRIWHSLADGGLNNQVNSLAVMGTDLYVGGQFSQSSGGTTNGLNRIARYNTSASSWHALTNNGLNGSNVAALAIVGTDLYAGGDFSQTSGGATTGLNNIARFDTGSGSWHALADNGLNNHVTSLAVIGIDLYVGGQFGLTFGGATGGLGNIARYETTSDTWHKVGGGLFSLVFTMAPVGTDLYVGAFHGIIRYNSTSGNWEGLPESGLNNFVIAMAASDSDLYLGGFFTQTSFGATPGLNSIAVYGLPPFEPSFVSTPAIGSTLAFTGISGTAASLNVEVGNFGEPGSYLDVSLTSITPGYTVVSGLPIIDMHFGAVTDIDVKCSTIPTAAGTLVLATNDPSNPSVTYDLTCVAVDPTYTATPADGSTLAFTGVSGSNPSLDIVVSNAGDAGSDLEVTLTSISGGYTIASGLPITSLGTTDSDETISVECDSVPVGAGTLVLATNDPANPSVTYTLTCVAAVPAYDATPADGATLAFSGAAGDNPSLGIDVSNAGDIGSELNVTLATISAGYSISGLPINGLETTDPPVTINVECDSVPAADGTLTLTTDDPTNPSVSYDLTCVLHSSSGGSVGSGDDDRNSKGSKTIASSGITTFSFGRVYVSLPASAIPPGETNCKIIIADESNSGKYGFALDDMVYDIKVVCDSGTISILYAPMTICIRPKDGVITNKTVFHSHAGGGFTPLVGGVGPSGYVCGSTQALSLFTLSQFALPDTGFVPGQVTRLSAQPVASRYFEYDALTLEIPQLNVVMPIWGVPQTQNGWDVSWLGENAGYLYGTAYPTWVGNSVLTAHVWDADNSAGPFYRLRDLQHGDEFYVHSGGQTYVYEVRTNHLVSEKNLSVMKDSAYSLITLITCESFSENTGEYLYRRAVQAVLVSVQ